METYLVIGLGNPGKEYQHTRHNAGFDVVDILSQKLRARLGRRRGGAIVGEAVRDTERIVLAQPQTYMNRSGESVASLMQWYKTPLSHLIVIYDDVDLIPGIIRVRPSGSPGTHNGMRSIAAELGETGFPRVRVGIGATPAQWDIADWVLSHYQDEKSRAVAFDSYLAAADATLVLIDEGVDAAMRKYNQKATIKEDA